MILKHIEVWNFRCLKCISLPMYKLTTLIGENDSGKSSTLDLLDMALSDLRPDDNDYYRDDAGTVAESITVILTFEIDDADRPAAEAFVAQDGLLQVRKVFSATSSETYYKGPKYVDERLNQSFGGMTAGELDQVLETFGIAHEGRLNKDRRLELIEAYRERAPTEEDWISVPPSKLRDILPRFERYRAIDYQSPESLVQKTLQTVYESTVFETRDDGQRQPVRSLRTLKAEIEAEINNKVGELLVFVRRYNERVTQISYDPTIDFSRGLKPGEFLVDDGRGLHYLSKSGDGTKRRMFMATLDWDRQVMSEQVGSTRPIIRGYDEPDVNLHYEAQRMMYQTISDIVQQEGSRVQAIICTHSLTMIDRAPATSINLLGLSESGCTTASYLRTDDDPEIEEFLHLLASELGITNTMVFYERCYVIIEGATEENALPVFYRRLYKRSPLEDGIRFINIEGKGGRRGLLKLLGKNRQAITLSLLDPDTELIPELQAADFEQQVLDKQVFYIGDHEFEDAFADEVLCLCLEQVWPRVDGLSWDLGHLRPLRENPGKKKYSTALLNMIRLSSETGPECKKPVLGVELAKRCPIDSIPEPLVRLFERAREVAGVAKGGSL